MSGARSAETEDQPRVAFSVALVERQLGHAARDTPGAGDTTLCFCVAVSRLLRRRREMYSLDTHLASACFQA